LCCRLALENHLQEHAMMGFLSGQWFHRSMSDAKPMTK